MLHSWNVTTLASETDALRVLTTLQGDSWLSLGHSQPFDRLVPAIDRGQLSGLRRVAKLQLERRAIDYFRASACFFASPGEETAHTDDFVALMVLRHHGVPIRLLDWSASLHVAAYFAVCENDDVHGELRRVPV